MKEVTGNIVDILNDEIYPATLVFGNKIESIKRARAGRYYIIPGFVDAHIHIESSMLTPAEFARIATVHGTIAVVADPHEIANVLGVPGVKYMIEDGGTVPLKFYFGAPSCVPASPFETAGSTINSAGIEELLRMDEIKYLGEVMNFHAVINNDPDMLRKIHIATRYGKLVDGHAPGLGGAALREYVRHGISTDHECQTRAEALEKLSSGMKIQIREGSAAKNFDDLIGIADEYYRDCMFCTDDLHPHDLIKGHINLLVKRALDCGIDMMKVLRIACVNPVMHYRLDVGLLHPGDYADFIVVDRDFNVKKTFINGIMAAEDGMPLIPRRRSTVVNRFEAREREVTDFRVDHAPGRINVIVAFDGQLVTGRQLVAPKEAGGCVVSDTDRDILKLAVINRYDAEAEPAIGFVTNFGLKKGAIASSIAHDSHNIIAVGVNDTDLCKAVNLIIKHHGGISVVADDREMCLPLPVAGLMSTDDYASVAMRYREIDAMAKSLGTSLSAPFMTLSFMALTVIPELKLSDKGLFDVNTAQFINLFSN